jgi:hypothetical protein
MAGSPGFNKRQKEMARREKQRLKTERRLQRKRDKALGLSSPEETLDLDDTTPEPGPAVDNLEDEP